MTDLENNHDESSAIERRFLCILLDAPCLTMNGRVLKWKHYKSTHLVGIHVDFLTCLCIRIIGQLLLFEDLLMHDQLTVSQKVRSRMAPGLSAWQNPSSLPKKQP